MSEIPEKAAKTQEKVEAVPSPVVKHVAEAPQFTADILRTTGDNATDRANARYAARMQLEFLGELQLKDNTETGAQTKTEEEIVGKHADEMVIDPVAEEVQEMIAGGTVDYILLRDPKGDIVGYANTEVTSLSGEDGAPDKKEDATLFIWLIGIRQDLRGKGAVRVLNEKVMNVAHEQAQKRHLNIVSVSMEGGRDVEVKFRKHWGMHGTYMEHPESNSLVEAPMIPAPASSKGGIITEDPLDPHSKWLIGMLDERKTISPEEFLAHTDLVYEGYNEGRSEEYQAVTGEIQAFTRSLIVEVLQGRPVRLVDHHERKKIAADPAGRRVVDAKDFSGWLNQHFPHLHERFRKIVEKQKGDYD
ncbi:hypothetical protein AUJ46_05335 [Candidatus Peregrinibacteria bacterium CG1_02_54_53]|nr:MAG: hypothetical protein AUJ46_05335 [Candidatus Peregrinibacteria bacterium CG1_02_54_53]